MIEINLRNGNQVCWDADEYDDYRYDGKYFILTKNDAWIGFYNLECIHSIIVKKSLK